MSDTTFIDRSIVAANRIVAAWLNVINNFAYKGRSPIYGTTTGSSTAYVLTLPATLSGEDGYASATSGDSFFFKLHTANGADPTLTIKTTGFSGVTLAITYNGVALTGSELATNQIVRGSVLGSNFELAENPFQLSRTVTQLTAAAAGTVNAITASYTPPITSVVDRMILCVSGTGVNSSTTPTFTPNSGTVTAWTIKKFGTVALALGDIGGQTIQLRANVADTSWELLNPCGGGNEVRSGVDSGTATAYVVTTDLVPTVAPYEGMLIGFNAANVSTNTTPTIALNGSAARTIVKGNGAALAVGDVAGFVICKYNASGTTWRLVNPATPTTTDTTWTPVVTFATPGDLNVVYSTQVGTYTRIGKLVVATYSIITSTFTHSTASGALRITGLPVAGRTLAGISQTGTVAWAGITKANYTDIASQLGSAGTFLTFTVSGSAQAIAALSTGDTPSAGTLILQGTITYLTD